MRHIQASAIRRLFDRARAIPGAIDLALGQPDFDVPEPIRAATIAAVEKGSAGYGPTTGSPELREKTRQYLIARYGLPEDDDVMITVGATGALALGALALISAGDEVLLPDPHFVAYDRLVRIAGGTPVLYDLYPTAFQLDPDAIERKITPKTRALILNTPANPTGVAFRADALAQLAEICQKRDIAIISDELYERFLYERPHASIKASKGVPSLLVGGFSKTFAMAGWRLGFAAGPKELIDKMAALQQFLYACPPTLVQQGALASFDVDVTPQIEAYRKKRDYVLRELSAGGYDVVRPDGTFFVYARVPWGDDESFCAAALDERVAIVPSRTFGTRTTHFRLSFAVSDENLAIGVGILKRLATRKP